MKKNEIPDDDWGLGDNVSRELCYATDAEGKYTTGLSPGWEAKNISLTEAWRDIRNNLIETKKEIADGKVSPLKYYMIFNLMEPFLLAASVGIATWRVKFHMKPFFYKRMSDEMLSKYAKELGITAEDMKNPDHVASLDIDKEIEKKSGIVL